MDISKSANVLVRQLSGAERDRVAPHFVEEPLEFKQTLYKQGGRVPDVYFPESGVVSMVTDLEDGETIETGTVGNEGLIGLPAVLGAESAPGRAFCQVPGRALRLPARVIHAEREQGTAWFSMLLRYVNFVTAMTAQTAACNRMHTVDARMSRWLLMTHDRVASDEFPLTQEFLTQMLGVARPSVNIAGATLQRAGFIQYRRGRIVVLDRRGLESASCECYRRMREILDATLNGRKDRTRPAKRSRR